VEEQPLYRAHLLIFVEFVAMFGVIENPGILVFRKTILNTYGHMCVSGAVLSGVIHVHLLLLLITMQKFLMASTHGKSDREMQLSQRTAPTQENKGVCKDKNPHCTVYGEDSCCKARRECESTFEISDIDDISISSDIFKSASEEIQVAHHAPGFCYRWLVDDDHGPYPLLREVLSSGYSAHFEGPESAKLFVCEVNFGMIHVRPCSEGYSRFEILCALRCGYALSYKDNRILVQPWYLVGAGHNEAKSYVCGKKSPWDLIKDESEISGKAQKLADMFVDSFEDEGDFDSFKEDHHSVKMAYHKQVRVPARRPRKKKKKNHLRRKFVEHSLGSDVGKVEDFMKSLPDVLKGKDGVTPDAVSKVVNILENTWLFFMALDENMTQAKFYSTVMLYIKSIMGSSLVLTVTSLISEFIKLFDGDQPLALENQSGDLSIVQDPSVLNNGNAFSALLRSCRANWRQATNSPLFDKVGELLAICVIAGLCEATQVTFDIKGFTLIKPDVVLMEKNAFSIIDAVFDVVIFFSDKIYACWKMKSVMPLWLAEDEVIALDDEFNFLFGKWPLIKACRYDDAGVTKGDFELRLDRLGKKFKVLTSTATDKFEKKLYDGKYKAVLRLIFDSTAIDHNVKRRKRPFIFGFFGESRTGKSVAARQVSACLAERHKIDYGDNYTYYRNPILPFWQGWQNRFTTIIYDDFAQAKNTANITKPHELIEVDGNQEFIPPMAAVEDKETARVAPSLVAVTGHDETMNAFELSICPGSVQKRMPYVIMTTVKEEFSVMDSRGVFQGIDTELVRQYYTDPDGSEAKREIDDIHLFTVKEPYFNGGEMANLLPYRVIKWRGEPLINITAPVLLAFLSEKCGEHFKREAEMMNRGETTNPKTAPKCDKGDKDNPCPNTLNGCTVHNDFKRAIQNCHDRYGNECQYIGRTTAAVEPPSRSEIETYGKFPDDSHELRTAVTSNVQRGKVPARDSSAQKRGKLGEKKKEMTEHGLWSNSWAATMLSYSFDTIASKAYQAGAGKARLVDRAGAYHIVTGTRWFMNTFDWLNFVPSSWIHKPGFKYVFRVMDSKQIRWNFYKRLFAMYMPVLMTSMIGVFQYRYGNPGDLPTPSMCFFLSGSFGVAMLPKLAGVYKDCEDALMQKIVKRNDVSAYVSNEQRDVVMSKAWQLAGLVLAIGVTAKAAKAILSLYSDSTQGPVLPEGRIGSAKPQEDKKSLVERLSWVKEETTLENQTVLAPDSKKEADNRDKEKSQWLKPFAQRLPLSKRCQHMSDDQMKNALQNNMLNVVFRQDTSTGEVSGGGNMIFLRPNFVMFPWHFWENKTYDKKGNVASITLANRLYVSGLRFPEDQVNSSMKLTFDMSRTVKIPGADMCVSAIKNAGPVFSDIVDLFVSDKMAFDYKGKFNMFYKTNKGVVHSSAGTYQIQQCTHHPEMFLGARYTTNDGLCFPGLCGAPVVSSGNGSTIVGIHVAGHTDTFEGFACQVTSAQLLEAINTLTNRIPGLFPLEPKCAPANFGQQSILIKEGTLDPKNFLNFQTESSPLAYIGPAVTTQSGGSMTKKFTIAEDMVKEHLGWEKPFFPPVMRPKWKGTQAWHDKVKEHGITLPSEPFDKALLEYRDDVSLCFQKSWYCDYAPLSLDQNLMGIDGKRFFNGIDWTTAMGVPYTGNKYQALVNPDDHHNRVLKPQFLKEFEEADRRIREGQPLGSIFKQFNKDEWLPKDGKCRKIFCGQFVTNLLIRKYFLPVVAIIQSNSLDSGCAVGINAHSPEWSELMDFVTHHGKDNILAWDASGHDARLSSELRSAAHWLMIQWAGLIPGYNETDLVAMKALSEDLLHPFVEVDGALVVPTMGVNVSGTPLTVVENSLCVMLQARTFFKFLYPHVRFKEHVNLMTYGDDAEGSRADDVPGFNNVSFMKWAADYGIILTSPNKSDEMKELWKSSEVDFLKRSDTYVPELGLSVGALAEDSMQKMLYGYVKKKNSGHSEKTLFADNLSNVLLESFFHGREFYEEKRSGVRKIAEGLGIVGWVPLLEADFDSRCEDYGSRYSKQACEYFRNKNSQIPRIYHGGAVHTAKVEEEGEVLDTG